MDPRPVSGVAGDRELPTQVASTAKKLAMLFSWLTNELDARRGAAGAAEAVTEDEWQRQDTNGDGDRKAAGDTSGDAAGDVGHTSRSQTASPSPHQPRRQENRGGIWALTVDLHESRNVLVRATAAAWGAVQGEQTSSSSLVPHNTTATITTPNSSGSSASGGLPATNATAASEANAIAFSCFRWGGYITRSLSNRGGDYLTLAQVSFPITPPLVGGQRRPVEQ